MSLLGTLVADIVAHPPKPKMPKRPRRPRGERDPNASTGQLEGYDARTAKAMASAVEQLRPYKKKLAEMFELNEESPSGLIWKEVAFRRGRPVTGKPVGALQKGSATHRVQLSRTSLRGMNMRTDAIVTLLKEES